MKIEVTSGDITTIPVDGIVVSLCEDSERLGVPTAAVVAVDTLLGGAIGALLDAKGIKGKANEVTVVNTLGKLPSRMVAVVGLGKQGEVTTDRVRDAAAEGCRALRKLGCTRIAMPLLGAGTVGMDERIAARAIAEGVGLGLYTFTRYKAAENPDVEVVLLVTRDAGSVASLEAAVSTGVVLYEATNLARDMVNEPANYMTPSRMAQTAQDIAATYNLTATVLERDDMVSLGMGALLGVAQGSAEPPKFIRLDYSAGGPSAGRTAFVGKAITFDSGGISIKPSEGMHEMKDDMAGGASVIAALMAIARLQIPVNVTGLIPATENLPGGRAFRPGDVLRAMNGKTIEIMSTDAEGRLILADALSYAVREKMSPLVDIATLTGACRVALGNSYSGVFSNDEDVARRFMDASVTAGEKMWRLPLPDEYRELNKSLIADIKNTGNRYGGAITAALFVSEFAGSVPWLHADIAGTAGSSKDCGAVVKGATGVPVRTLCEFVRTR
ncbi:MAG: leucyl aminopeptidase [Dehalococcoidia bacterium]|nr:leucyl aminopeptidase [Dehalococcoidia bacterium]